MYMQQQQNLSDDWKPSGISTWEKHGPYQHSLWWEFSLRRAGSLWAYPALRPCNGGQQCSPRRSKRIKVHVFNDELKDVFTSQRSSLTRRTLPELTCRNSFHRLQSTGNTWHWKDHYKKKISLVIITMTIQTLTMMYAFLFMKRIKRSRHQKQHFKQQSRKRANTFWAPTHTNTW